MADKLTAPVGEKTFSRASSSVPPEESTGTVLGGPEALQGTLFSTESPSPVLSTTHDILKDPTDVQSKWDSMWGCTNSLNAVQATSPHDFKSGTKTAGVSGPEENNTEKQTTNPILKALQEKISKRTEAIDAATKEKEKKILAASKEYLERQKANREKQITEARAVHKKTQDNDQKKIEDFKKSGAVWNAVGMVVDLDKPNPYSKNTERMRSILSTLNDSNKIALE